MPNQNDPANPTVPNTNPDPSAQGVNPTLTVDPTSTPPFGAVTEEVSTPFPPSGTAAPVGDIASAGPAPQPTTTGSVSSGGSGRGRGRVVATILGILFLVGGVVAGIILVQQQQEIREKAANCPGGSVAACTQICIDGCPGSDNPTQCVAGCPAACQNICSGGAGFVCGNGRCDAPGETQQNCPQDCGAAGGPTATPRPGCTIRYSNNCIVLSGGCSGEGERFSGSSCPTTESSKGKFQLSDGTYCPQPGAGSCEQVDHHFGGVNGITSPGGVCTCKAGGTPGPTPAFSAQCVDVKSYDTNWVALTPAQLAQLKVGDKVRFTVRGTATSGVFDKAIFTINGAKQPETTSKKPNSTELFVEYTIPAGVTQFNIGAIVHHLGQNVWR